MKDVIDDILDNKRFIRDLHITPKPVAARRSSGIAWWLIASIGACGFWFLVGWVAYGLTH